MELMFYFLQFLVVIIVFCVLLVRDQIRKEEERAKRKAVDRSVSQNYKLLVKTMNAKSVNAAENYLSQAEENYAAVHHIATEAGKKVLDYNLNSIREEVEEKQRDKWETNASKILSNLFDTYYLIVEHDFDNVERAYKAKARCMKYWDQYWQSTEAYDIPLYPKQFLRNFMVEYDPCFESGGSLQDRLDQAITEMKPEYKRKMGLYRRIVDTVAEVGSIMRSDLLKKSFPDAAPKEIECCYKELIKKYKLVEVKLGNRYFVSLSDKELEKRNSKVSASNPEKETK